MFVLACSPKECVLLNLRRGKGELVQTDNPELRFEVRLVAIMEWYFNTLQFVSGIWQKKEGPIGHRVK